MRNVKKSETQFINSHFSDRFNVILLSKFMNFFIFATLIETAPGDFLTNLVISLKLNALK